MGSKVVDKFLVQVEFLCFINRVLSACKYEMTEKS